MKKKKLIHFKQENLLECDNPECDYVLPNTKDVPEMSSFINQPCPECNFNLLTEQDYVLFKRVMWFVDFVNTWFGWLGTYEPKTGKNNDVKIKIDNGINIIKDE